MSIINSIFIQIASYRDIDIKNTIKSCLDNAKYPENITFGIVNQYDENDGTFLDILEFTDAFKIINIHYTKSKGCCWARHKTQLFYSGETFVMQIDSHLRFQPKWDETCINMYNDLKQNGVNKPLISTYLPEFTYNHKTNITTFTHTPCEMVFTEYNKKTGIPQYNCKPILNNVEFETLTIKGKYFSGHFSFAGSSFIDEIKYDPNIYFMGEETLISIRAYTYGYDIYIPTCIVAHHNYLRDGRTTHWYDNYNWIILENKSVNRYKQLLSNFANKTQMYEQYGIGKERTFMEYCNYINIELYENCDKYTSNNSKLRSFDEEYNYYINIPEITHSQLDNVKYIFILFKDCFDNEVYKYNFLNFKENKENKKILITFSSKSKPCKWLYIEVSNTYEELYIETFLI